MKVVLERDIAEIASITDDGVTCIPVNAFFDNPRAALTDINFHYERVEAGIDSLRNGSAAGPDQISVYFLKQTKTFISRCLSNIMQSSFQSSCIPQSLKDAYVIPIPKGGNKSDPSNYRPVSLTSHIIKLMERIIFEDIVSYLEEIDYLNDKQHGFRKGFSTMSELLTHYNEIVNSLESGHPYPCIMLDYSKAFDRVHHSLLLNKVKGIGINGLLGCWLANFLLGRRQCVKVGSLFSDYIDVLSGVPQGTILGPLLFLVFINDIDSDIENSRVSCYADDTKIAKSVSCLSNCQMLQEDLKRICRWNGQNLMSFNKDKLEVLVFSIKNVAPEIVNHEYITGDGVSIKHVTTSKDLGVLFDMNGSFISHITEQCSKATKISGYIFRTFISRDQTVLITLFKSLILPIIEYGCILWHPHIQNEINSVEEVQRIFTRKIKGLQGCNYWERLKVLNIFSLERRRERYIILYTFKIIFSVVPNPGIEWCNTTTRRGRLITIQKVNPSICKAGSTLKFNSFIFVCARLFNCLPKDIRNFNPIGNNSMDLLKSKLDGFLRMVPDEPRLDGYAGFSKSTSNTIFHQTLCM